MKFFSSRTALAPRAGVFRLSRVALILVGLAGSSAFAQTATPAPAAVTTGLVSQPLAVPTSDRPDEQPSPQHAWIPGHWRWGQGAYVWIAGHWDIPPIPNATWVGPEWQQQGSGYVLREGYWQQPVTTVQETVATQPPPPSQPEMITEQPSPVHVWVSGYWDWRGNQYVWIAGRWDLPPKPNQVWVPTRWEVRGNRFVLVSGFWRETVVPTPAPMVVATPAPSTQVIVVTAPPPPRQEVMYMRPSPRHEWVSGFWAWRGNQYVWLAGHWEQPPRGHHHWEAPRWDRRGGNYIFIEGHWR